MNTVNKSTGFSLFQLRMGRTPRIVPPLVTSRSGTDGEESTAREVIEHLQIDTATAQDNLLQAAQANNSRHDDFLFETGERVLVSTKDDRNLYKRKGN